MTQPLLTTFFPPTSVPCPTWCQEPAGHPFEQESTRDLPAREHTQYFGDRAHLATSIGSFAEWDSGHEVRQRPLVEVWSRGDITVESLTLEEARRLAALLTSAADSLEQMLAWADGWPSDVTATTDATAAVRS